MAQYSKLGYVKYMVIDKNDNCVVVVYYYDSLYRSFWAYKDGEQTKLAYVPICPIEVKEYVEIERSESLRGMVFTAHFC